MMSHSRKTPVSRINGDSAGYLAGSAGQTLVEFAIMLPFFLLIILGVIELSYALYNQHVLIKISREGSNLISRDTSLQDAATAMAAIATPPVNFAGAQSKLIFSVIRQGTQGINAGRPILYQRREIGYLFVPSSLTTQGACTFGGAPNYIAVNPDNDANLRITNLPSSVVLQNNTYMFLTEVYNSYTPISPFQNLAFRLPERLYASAWF
jgi:hypothetical protein